MNLKTSIIGYFKEPFAYLGLSLLIIDGLSGFNSIVDDFRTLLFVKYFYWCFFIPTLFLSIKLTTEPLKSVKEYRKKKKIGKGLMIIATIFLSLFVATLPPQFEPLMFFSDKLNAIKKPEIVLELKTYVIFGGLIVAQALLMFNKWSIRKQLTKDNIKIDTQVDYGTIFSSAWMIFIVLMIVFVYLDYLHVT